MSTYVVVGISGGLEKELDYAGESRETAFARKDALINEGLCAEMSIWHNGEKIDEELYGL